MGTVAADRDRTKVTCVLTGFTHTFLTVIGYNESCDRTLLTCRRDDLNDIVALFVTRTFSLRETDSLTDDLSLLVYAAAELCLRARDQFERDIVSRFLQLSLKSQLGNCAQHVILDLKQCLIVGFHTLSSCFFTAGDFIRSDHFSSISSVFYSPETKESLPLLHEIFP